MIELWQFLRNVLFSSCKWPVDVHVTLGFLSLFFILHFALSIFSGLNSNLTLLHSERPKLYTILAFLSAKRVKAQMLTKCFGMGTLNAQLLKGVFLLRF